MRIIQLLKRGLKDRGYSFKSETDTEVLANLMEFIYLKGKVSAEMAVRLALSKVVGAYGLAIICTDEPDMLMAARKGSPLVIGVGEGEYFLASDATPIVEYTKSVIYLNDNDIAIIHRNELILKTLNNDQLIPKIQTLDLDTREIEKGGFEHFMLKEIFEQPRSILDTFRGRVLPDHASIHLGGLYTVLDKLIGAKRIIIIGCGTSCNSGWAAHEFGKRPERTALRADSIARDLR